MKLIKVLLLSVGLGFAVGVFAQGGASAAAVDDASGSGRSGYDREMILTPGQEGVVTYKATENQVAFIRVTSEQFDPALEIRDEKGKVLAEVDDSSGSQDPSLLHYFESKGTFKFVVKAFKSAAGGRFRINIRSYSALRVEPDKPAVHDKDQVYEYIVVKCKKGTAYACSYWTELSSSLPRDGYGPLLESRGLRNSAIPLVGKSYDLNHFMWVADQDGTFALYMPRSAEPIPRTTLVQTLVSKPLKLARSSATVSCGTREISVFDIDGEASEEHELSLESAPADARVFISAPASEDGASQLVEHVAGDLKDSRRIRFRFLEKTNAKIFCFRAAAAPLNAKLTFSPFRMAMQGSGESNRSLLLGDTDHYRFPVQAGDLLEVRAESKNFDAIFDVWLPPVKGYGHRSTETLPGERDERFLGVVRATGDALIGLSSAFGAGSGPYRLTAKVLKPAILPFGSNETLQYSEGNTVLRAIPVKANQSIVLVVRSESRMPQIQFLSTSGQDVRVQPFPSGAKEMIYTIQSAEAGQILVWVGNGEQEAWTCTVRALDIQP